MQHELDSQLAPEVLEPLDDWVHLQPGAEEEQRGRIYVPAGLGDSPVQRCVVLAVGEGAGSLGPGDVVFALARKMIELRDGSRLAPRAAVIARISG